jgi:pyruvate/2-oxoglutarate dehydrogenase complex dihydrolipoamide acyltransferase (E2) component
MVPQMSEPDRVGRYQLLRPPPDRQLAIDAFAAIRGGHPMTALLELDVTAALEKLATMQRAGTRVSLFAFIVRSIAVAISEHPDLNLVRHGNRLVRFDDVDVNVPIEVQTPDGPFPRQVVLRRAQHRSAVDLYAELTEARRRNDLQGSTSAEDRWARRMLQAVHWLPPFARVALIRRIMRSAFRIKARAGTTLVTSVGKFAAIPGFSFTFTTGPRAAVFVVGGVTSRPWVVDGCVAPRSVLPLSVMVDHDLVDGAPAARFATRLRELIESGAELR